MLAALLIYIVVFVLGLDAALAGILGLIFHTDIGFLTWWLVVFTLHFVFAALSSKT